MRYTLAQLCEGYPTRRLEKALPVQSMQGGVLIRAVTWIRRAEWKVIDMQKK